MLALFILGLVAVAVGPALTILLDQGSSVQSPDGTTSAGMFVALNDNAATQVGRAA